MRGPQEVHTMPYHTMPCHTIPHHTLPYHTFLRLLYSMISCPTIPYPTMPYHTIPYHTLPYHAIPYYTIPYHIIPSVPHLTIPYHTMPYHAISCGFARAMSIGETLCWMQPQLHISTCFATVLRTLLQHGSSHLGVSQKLFCLWSFKNRNTWMSSCVSVRQASGRVRAQHENRQSQRSEGGTSTESC